MVAPEKNVSSGERQYPCMKPSRLPLFQASTWSASTCLMSSSAWGADFGCGGWLGVANRKGTIRMAIQYRFIARIVRRRSRFWAWIFRVFLYASGNRGRRTTALTCTPESCIFQISEFVCLQARAGSSPPKRQGVPVKKSPGTKALMSLQNIGRYEIISELGRGAMGLVYKAKDPTIGRIVALRTMRLHVHGLEADEMLRRFRHEAQAVGVLNHPNIVTIYDAAEQDKT